LNGIHIMQGSLRSRNSGMMDFKGNKRLFLLFPNIPGFQYSKPRRGYPGRSKAGGMVESLPAISKSDLSSFRFPNRLPTKVRGLSQ